MQEETTDRRGRSHPSRRTTVRDDRRIVRMPVMDRAATSRTIVGITDSVCYASFGVHSYHSTPFAADWNARNASISSFTLDWKPQVFAPPMMQTWTTKWNNIEVTGGSRYCLQHHDCRI
ncbi:uncharacterized protein TNCV_1255011 [Trichonephila clavipes]|nr:uncharacterized protein TNCV_1255011 [Trichonephila clavipes]